MKSFALLLLVSLSSSVFADVTWDLPVSEFGKKIGAVYLIDLTVGDKAKISSDYGFCTTANGKLAASGTMKVGSGDVKLVVLPGMKLSIEVKDEKKFLESLIESGAYAKCDWWTAHKGKYVRIIDAINGKSEISTLNTK